MNLFRTLLIGLILLSAIYEGRAQRTVRGVLVDSEGMPIRFAHALNKTLGLGKVTDINGRFQITARRGDTIQFSYVGYQAAELVVEPRHLVNYTKIMLTSDSLLLPAITIYADRAFKVPLNIKGEPIEIPGVEVTVSEDPVEAGDVGLGTSPGPGGVPGMGATIYGPFSYFSKEAEEKREAEEAYEDTKETLFYQKYIQSDSVKQRICEIYQIDPSQYDSILVSAHERFPEIQSLNKASDIWHWLLAYFREQLEDR